MTVKEFQKLRSEIWKEFNSSNQKAWNKFQEEQMILKMERDGKLTVLNSAFQRSRASKVKEIKHVVKIHN